MENYVDIINNKKRIVLFMRILIILLASIFTLSSTVCIVSLLMYLNEIYNVSYFNCFSLTILLPNIISPIFNELLNPLEKKVKLINKEIILLNGEYKDYQNKIRDNEIIEGIKIKFNNLSRDNKIILLNYIKEEIDSNFEYDNIDELSYNELYVIKEGLDKFKNNGELEVDTSYSKKKIINGK